MGSLCLISLVGLKELVWPTFTRMDMEEELTYERISLMSSDGKLKAWSVYLMKDHSILSKFFSRSIFRIMLAFFPLIFLKWLMYSWIIITLSEALLLDKKLS